MAPIVRPGRYRRHLRHTLPGVTPPGLYLYLVLLELVIAVPTFIALSFITAPYGRYGRAGWGPTLPSRVAWVVMECPASLLFAAVYLRGAHRAGLVPLLLLSVWELHYVHRAFVYPFSMRPGARNASIPHSPSAAITQPSSAWT